MLCETVFLSNVTPQMQVLKVMWSVIKSATRPQWWQSRAFLRSVFLFSSHFPRYWSLVPFSPLSEETDYSLHPPLCPECYRRPLIVTLFICAHSEAAVQGDKWALPCASACEGGVGLFMEMVWLHMRSPPLYSNVCIDTRKQSNKYSEGRLASLLWEQRGNLWWIGNRLRGVHLPKCQQHWQGQLNNSPHNIFITPNFQPLQ